MMVGEESLRFERFSQVPRLRVRTSALHAAYQGSSEDF
jgi:hypothetical protein